MFKRTAWLLGAFVLLCGLHLWLYANMPEARRNSGWPSIVMRNWHEQGFWHLGGKLVNNAGGLDAGEIPFVYPGHRPYFLILPYWLKELPGAGGQRASIRFCGCARDICRSASALRNGCSGCDGGVRHMSVTRLFCERGGH